jgi:hypothetical protein
MKTNPDGTITTTYTTIHSDGTTSKRSETSGAACTTTSVSNPQVRSPHGSTTAGLLNDPTIVRAEQSVAKDELGRLIKELKITRVDGTTDIRKVVVS